jgi:hypothetical protein
MESHVALVKGNRQMGFQVDRATTFFSSTLMRSPDGISCSFG